MSGGLVLLLVFLAVVFLAMKLKNVMLVLCLSLFLVFVAGSFIFMFASAPGTTLLFVMGFGGIFTTVIVVSTRRERRAKAIRDEEGHRIWLAANLGKDQP